MLVRADPLSPPPLATSRPTAQHHLNNLFLSRFVVHQKFHFVFGITPHTPSLGTFSTPDPQNGSQTMILQQKKPKVTYNMMQLATVCVLQFCLPIAPNRVPPYETRPFPGLCH